MVTMHVHDANVLVDVLWTLPSAMFIMCSLPRLPHLAKLRHHRRLDPLNSTLALADAGAHRSEYGRDPAN